MRILFVKFPPRFHANAEEPFRRDLRFLPRRHRGRWGLSKHLLDLKLFVFFSESTIFNHFQIHPPFNKNHGVTSWHSFKWFSLMDSNWSFSSPTKASASSSSSLARPKSKIWRHFKCLNLPDGMATRELSARDICVVWHPNWLKASGSMLLRFVNTSCFCCNTAAKPQLSRWNPAALSEQRQGKQVKFLECPR